MIRGRSSRWRQSRQKSPIPCCPLRGSSSGGEHIPYVDSRYDCVDVNRKAATKSNMQTLKKTDMSTILDQAKRPTIPKSVLRKDLRKFLKLLGHQVELEVKRVAPNTYRISQST